MGTVCGRERRNTGDVSGSVYFESLYAKSMAKNTWTDRYHIRLECFSTSTGRLLKKRSSITTGCRSVAVIQISLERKASVEPRSSNKSKLISILHMPVIKYAGLDIRSQVPRNLPMNIWSGTLTVFGFFDRDNVGPGHVTLTGKILSEKVFIEQQINPDPLLTDEQWVHLSNMLQTEMSKIKETSSSEQAGGASMPKLNVSFGGESRDTGYTSLRQSLDVTSRLSSRVGEHNNTSESEDGDVVVRRYSRERRPKLRRKDTPSHHVFDFTKRSSQHDSYKGTVKDKPLEEEPEIILESDSSVHLSVTEEGEGDEEGEQRTPVSSGGSQKGDSCDQLHGMSKSGSDTKMTAVDGTRRKKRSLVSRMNKRGKEKRSLQSLADNADTAVEYFADPLGEDADDECEPVRNESTSVSVSHKVDADMEATETVQESTSDQNAEYTAMSNIIDDSDNVPIGADDALIAEITASSKTLSEQAIGEASSTLQSKHEHGVTPHVQQTAQIQMNQDLDKQEQQRPQQELNEQQLQHQVNIPQNRNQQPLQKSSEEQQQSHPQELPPHEQEQQENTQQVLLAQPQSSSRDQTSGFSDIITPVSERIPQHENSQASLISELKTVPSIEISETPRGPMGLPVIPLSERTVDSEVTYSQLSDEERLELGRQLAEPSASPILQDKGQEIDKMNKDVKETETEVENALKDQTDAGADKQNTDTDKGEMPKYQSSFQGGSISKGSIDLAHGYKKGSGQHGQIKGDDESQVPHARPTSKTISFANKTKYATSKQQRTNKSMDEGVKKGGKDIEKKHSKQFKHPPMEAFGETPNDTNESRNDVNKS